MSGTSERRWTEEEKSTLYIENILKERNDDYFIKKTRTIILSRWGGGEYMKWNGENVKHTQTQYARRNLRWRRKPKSSFLNSCPDYVHQHLKTINGVSRIILALALNERLRTIRLKNNIPRDCYNIKEQRRFDYPSSGVCVCFSCCIYCCYRPTTSSMWLGSPPVVVRYLPSCTVWRINDEMGREGGWLGNKQRFCAASLVLLLWYNNIHLVLITIHWPLMSWGKAGRKDSKWTRLWDL